MNLVDVDLDQEGAVLGGRSHALPQAVMSALGKEKATTATIGFRPEAVRVVGEGEGFPFEVVVVEELGSDAYAYGTLHTNRAAGEAVDKLITIRVDARKPPMKGETIYLQIAADDAHIFSTGSGLRVSGPR
jgi:multiple sugar transport system ATP-binding protein